MQVKITQYPRKIGQTLSTIGFFYARVMCTLLFGLARSNNVVTQRVGGAGKMLAPFYVSGRFKLWSADRRERLAPPARHPCARRERLALKGLMQC